LRSQHSAISDASALALRSLERDSALQPRRREESRARDPPATRFSQENIPLAPPRSNEFPAPRRIPAIPIGENRRSTLGAPPSPALAVRNPRAGASFPSERPAEKSLARLGRRIPNRFAGSFADRLHRQMGLSDLESSRDGFGAYNCHRRANERSLVNVLERGPYLLLPLLPLLSPVLLFLLYLRLSPGPARASPYAPTDVPPRSFNSRSLLPLFCRRWLLPPVAASLVDSFATGVKAVNRECACNYATWAFYSS